MKAKEIVNELIINAWERDYTNTCDSCKAGSLDTDVDKVAVSMFATPEVIMRVL